MYYRSRRIATVLTFFFECGTSVGCTCFSARALSHLSLKAASDLVGPCLVEPHSFESLRVRVFGFSPQIKPSVSDTTIPSFPFKILRVV